MKSKSKKLPRNKKENSRKKEQKEKREHRQGYKPRKREEEERERLTKSVSRPTSSDLFMSSAPKQQDIRRGTRISFEIPITVTSLDSVQPFSEPCLTVLVNPQGCAVRFRHPVDIGVAVRLEGLPAGPTSLRG